MTPTGWRQRMPIYLVFVLAFPLGMWWVETHAANGPTLCLFRQVTHLDCPSCGLTLAFRAMGRLDTVSAIQYNPLSPAIFLGTVILWCYALAMLCTRGQVRLPRWWQRRHVEIVWSAVGIFLLVGFVRLLYELRHPPSPPPPLPTVARWMAPR